MAATVWGIGFIATKEEFFEKGFKNQRSDPEGGKKNYSMH